MSQTARICRRGRRECSRILRAGQIPTDSDNWKEAETALSGFAPGQGRHRAQLNLGDCFAFAAAKNHRAALLFKGDDFDKTDIRLRDPLNADG